MGPCHQSCQPPSLQLLPTSRFHAPPSPALPYRLWGDMAVMVADKLDFPLCALICRLQRITIIFNELSRACVPKEGRMFETSPIPLGPFWLYENDFFHDIVLTTSGRMEKNIIFISTFIFK